MWLLLVWWLVVVWLLVAGWLLFGGWLDGLFAAVHVGIGDSRLRLIVSTQIEKLWLRGYLECFANGCFQRSCRNMDFMNY